MRTWSAMAPAPSVLRALVQGHLGLGEAQAAIAAARRALETSPPSYALSDLAFALDFAGDYTTLESELRSREPGLSARQRYWLSRALATQGRRVEALRVLDAVGGPPTDDSRNVRFLRAMHLAGDGDAAGVWAEAQALLPLDARLAERLAPELARLGDLAHGRELATHLAAGSPGHETYLAMVDWKEGRLAQARARLTALETRYPLPRGLIAPAFLRAEVAADEGLDTEVVEALRRLERLPFQPHWRSWTFPQGLFLLARSLERLGKRGEARVELNRLLDLWRGADQGAPLLEKARSLKARLDASPVGGAPGRARSP